MTTNKPDLQGLCDAIISAPQKARRKLVAVTGAPASGKSTLAANLADALNANGCFAQAMPMDGFHLDNAILQKMGLLARKGAPATFDVDGFERTLRAVAQNDRVYIPVFRRDLELAIAAASVIDENCDTVVVEGNYLLLDELPWSALADLWDVSIYLDVSLETLTQRLRERWQHYQLTAAQIKTKIEDNDLPNAQTVIQGSKKADITVSN